jgi:hypothetical protein
MTMPGAYDPNANGANGGQNTANGPKKPDGTFTPSGYTLEKDAKAKSDEEWNYWDKSSAEKATRVIEKWVQPGMDIATVAAAWSTMAKEIEKYLRSE